MTGRPLLDVIIVSYNTRDDLVTCLDSVAAHPPASLATTFVVDNASSDGSPDQVAQRFPSVSLIRLDRNVGFGAANNVALRASRANLVLLLNSDTIVAAGSIDALIDRLIETGAVAAGPKLVDGDGRTEVSFGSMLSPFTELMQRTRVRLATRGGALARSYIDRHVSKEREVDWVSGACLLVRRDAAVGAGLFDERYFLYEEDVDFCAALRARGGRILFTPRVTVVHRRGRSMRVANAPAEATHYDRSHLAFYEKHAPHWAPWLRRWLTLRGKAPR